MGCLQSQESNGTILNMFVYHCVSFDFLNQLVAPVRPYKYTVKLHFMSPYLSLKSEETYFMRLKKTNTVLLTIEGVIARTCLSPFL